MDKHEKLKKIGLLTFTRPVCIQVGIKARGEKEIIFHSAEFRTPSQLLGFINTMLINAVHALLSEASSITTEVKSTEIFDKGE